MATGSAASSTDLRSVPGIGPRMEADLNSIGIHQVGDLRDRDPQQMYEELCSRQATSLDRCVLYVLRCAAYYASRRRHDPELLKWWNWTDARMP